jgi:hypothetical protein
MKELPSGKGFGYEYRSGNGYEYYEDEFEYYEDGFRYGDGNGFQLGHGYWHDDGDGCLDGNWHWDGDGSGVDEYPYELL